MAHIELNDSTINSIIKDIDSNYTVAYKKEDKDSVFTIVIKYDNEYYEGKILQLDEGKSYSISGDTEFKKIYPKLDKDTNEIVSI